jgi:5-formyltetrahydrofolate cyclo-ligase
VKDKASLRQLVSARVAALDPQARQSASACLRDALRAAPFWMESRRILLFAPLGDEPDLWPLVAEGIAAGKVVCLPRFEPAARQYAAARVESMDRDIRTGAFGIREPRPEVDPWPLSRLDLILVPGVAFSVDGLRLGRGKGYYDRLLPQTTGAKCGVAFDEQIEPVIPSEPHDVILDWILTPTRCLRSVRPAC